MMENNQILSMESKFEVVKIIKKTKADGFADLNVGDIIRVTIPIETNSRGKVYQIYADIEYVKCGWSVKFHCAFSKLANYMNMNAVMRPIN